MSQRIDPDVLDVLKDATCDGQLLKLGMQLERKLYVKTNKVVAALGGKWSRQAKGHVFDEDAAPLIADAITAGEYVDRKKAFQFYRTPSELVKRMLKELDIQPGTNVLEPSAGDGAIAKEIHSQFKVECVAGEDSIRLTCIELDAQRCEDLKRNVEDVDCIHADFLQTSPDEFFDRIAMNPPFSRCQDIDHVTHAYKHLKPGGRLAAIVSAGMLFRTDKKAQAFRDWFGQVEILQEKLDPGTFKKSGTMVLAVLIVLEKPAAEAREDERPRSHAQAMASTFVLQKHQPSAAPIDYSVEEMV